MNIAKKKNLNFTAPEVQLIAEILSRDLPEAEKERVQKMLSVMSRNTKN